MWDANVGATERDLDAAIAAGVPRIVYISTANVFGNTRGGVPDETHQRDLSRGFVSYYDETKFRAHEAAQRRIAAGAPIILIQPTQVYGPDDHSAASGQLRRAYLGRLRFTAFASLGMAWVHVHDVADGVVAALDRGRLGEAYILAGAPRRLGESIEAAARLGGRRPPRLVIPTRLFRAIAALNDRVGGLPGLPPNAREIISASDDVTYWADAGKAARELGFTARSLEQGIVDTWGATAHPAPSA
jgi:dihydroflavonol-4-reductase